MDPKEPKTIVVFRKSRRKEPDPDAEVTAVFPEVPWGSEYEMACYSRVGQHGGCGREWYNATKPARPAEYRELAKELRQLGYRLDIRRRISQGMDAHRRADWHRMMQPNKRSD